MCSLCSQCSPTCSLLYVLLLISTAHHQKWGVTLKGLKSHAKSWLQAFVKELLISEKTFYSDICVPCCTPKVCTNKVLLASRVQHLMILLWSMLQSNSICWSCTMSWLSDTLTEGRRGQLGYYWVNHNKLRTKGTLQVFSPSYTVLTLFNSMGDCNWQEQGAVILD